MVINQPDNYAGVQWMLRCSAHCIPYVVVTHYTSEWDWPIDDVARKLADGYLKALVSFFVSHRGRILTEKQVGSRIENSAIVRCPYQVDFDCQCVWPTLGEHVHLASVSRLDPGDKGQDLILEVMSMEKWRRRELAVTIFGTGKHSESLKRYKEYLSLENVFFGGFAPHVQEIWETHHGLLMPSRAEGLPASMVEAMICGRVCVATDVGGIPEILVDDVTGFLAEFPCCAGVDAALERMWLRRRELRSMGVAAMSRAKRLIPRSPEVVFYNQLLALISE